MHLDQSHVLNSTQEPNPGRYVAGTVLSNTICPRTETILALAQLIEKHSVILIRGTPASGKSIMAKLLCRCYASERKQRIVFVADWADWFKSNKKTVDFLVDMCHLQGHRNVRKGNLLNEVNDDLIFILDEGQLTYDDPYFWYSFLKERLAMLGGPRFCIFSSYSSSITGSPDYPISSPPTILRSEQQVSLIVPQSYVGHNVCLFFQRHEFDDAVKRHVDVMDYTINRDVQDYIFTQTNGHPGVAGAMLRYIDQVLYSAALRN